MQIQPRWLSRVGIVAILLASLAIGSGQRSAQAANPPSDQAGISVNGIGYVAVTPDIAQLSLGVSATAGSVGAARGQAAEAMQRVQATLGSKGVAEKDIQTQYFNVQPEMSYDRGRGTVTGYTVSSQIAVTLRDIENTADTLDAAIAAGGDVIRVNGIRFTIEHPDKFIAPARQAAIRDALTHASQFAQAAGVSVGRARSITELGNSTPQPVPLAAAASAAPRDSGVPTPVNPGQLQLQAAVAVVYELQ